MAGYDGDLDLGERLSLAALLDRALNKGVVIWGDATISIAGVDLIYVGLKALAASVDTARKLVPEPLEVAPPGRPDADGYAGARLAPWDVGIAPRE